MSTAFVVALGSNTCKIGIAGEDAPRVVEVPVRGKMKDGNEGSFLLAHNAWGRGMTNPRVAKKYAIEDVMVRPEGMGAIHSYEGVAAMVGSFCAGVDRVGDATKEVKDDTFVFSTDTIAGNRSQLAKLAEVMFESVGVGGMYGNDDATYALFSNGMVSGTVLDVGHGGTRVTPVNDGNFVIRSDGIAQRSPVGGATQSMLLAELLGRDAAVAGMGLSLDATAEVSDANYITTLLVEDIKEASIACLPTTAVEDCEYELPDERTIVIPKEVRTACGDVLFNPGVFTPTLGAADVAVPARSSVIELLDLYQQATKTASIDANRDFSYLLDQQIVVCGGATFAKNFQGRFEAELAARPALSAAYKGGFLFADDRKYSSFIGASIMGSMEAMSGLVSTREAYQEYGSSITMSWGYPSSCTDDGPA